MRYTYTAAIIIMNYDFKSILTAVMLTGCCCGSIKIKEKCIKERNVHGKLPAVFSVQCFYA